MKMEFRNGLKSIPKYIVITAIVTILSVFISAEGLAQNTEFDRIVEEFNRSRGKVRDANNLFSYLDKEGFTDSKIVFTNNTPIIPR